MSSNCKFCLSNESLFEKLLRQSERQADFLTARNKDNAKDVDFDDEVDDDDDVDVCV